MFHQNIDYLKAFRAVEGGDRVLAIPYTNGDVGKESEGKPPSEVETSTREFLDSCFVMMPFGEWFDGYYQEIYAPAIKDAGFEPIRADQIFDTGSVVEQIWQQIEKSKVLLADLTGKNPNVFYELGSPMRLENLLYSPPVI